MKKNQPQNISRRFLLAGLSYSALCLSAPVGAASPAALQLSTHQLIQPSSALSDDNGDNIYLSDLAGRGLVINFWASWCAPCVVELPMLDRAAGVLGADNIDVILVSVDRGGKTVAGPFLRQRGIVTARALYDPQASWGRHFSLRGLPTTLLVRADQASYALHASPAVWDDEQVLGQIRGWFSAS